MTTAFPVRVRYRPPRGEGVIYQHRCDNRRLSILLGRLHTAARERIPLLIGTASFKPDPGYNVPLAHRDLRTREPRLTPVLPRDDHRLRSTGLSCLRGDGVDATLPPAD